MGYQRISFFLKPVGSEPLLRKAIPSNGAVAIWPCWSMTQAEVWRGGMERGCRIVTRIGPRAATI